MLRIISIISIVLTFFACTKQKEEVIDLHDIIAESDNYKEGDTIVSDEKMEDDSTQMVLTDFQENGIEVTSVSFIDKSMFPERFGVESSKKYQLNFEGDTIRFYNWRYKDSVKTINAFFNWIDNFGKKGKSIFIGEEKNLQVNPFLLFVSDTSMIFIDAKKNASKKEWVNYFKSKGYSSDWNYILQQSKHGKVRWEQ